MCWALVLACMAVVLWIRTIPLSLPAAEELAEQMTWENVQARMATELVEPLRAEGRRERVETAAREWIRRNRSEYEAARAALADRLRSELSFKGNDGRTYAYLGDFDSYVWLRNARNYLRQGTTCDAVIDGECRDTYGNAPVGSRMIYNRSLHIAAIVAVHKAITFFHPGYPLSASAFLVPVLLGVLGVIPAFFIGRRLAGDLGGLFAAIVISAHPLVLLRTVGSDNDVWNVVLPLFIAWAMIAALNAQKMFLAAGYGVLAGLLTGLQAATWRGWIFIYIVAMGGVLGHLILAGIRQARGAEGWRIWRLEAVQNIACVVVAYCVSAAVFATLAGAEESYFSIPSKLIDSVAGLLFQNTGGGIADGGDWPQALATVTELGKSKSADLPRYMGGAVFYFGSWLGLLLLLFPRGPWKRRHFVLMACSIALYAGYYAFAPDDLRKDVMIILLALPLAAELLAGLFDKNPVHDIDQGFAWVAIVWFFAGLNMFSDSIRFVILFIVPFGLAFGVTAGRIYERFRTQAPRIVGGYARVASLLGFVLVGSLLIPPVLRGYTAVKTYRPSIYTAWWDTLVRIRNESRPDAIVNTWWEYGYWVKYVAERRVSSDGGSLLTHVPHWLAKALVAPTEAESRGILRMLNCGSDATPLPEGALGAYGKLTATGLDEVTAYSILTDIVKLGRVDAQRYLAGRGFNASQQNAILSSTHCLPPEAFLIVSKQLLFKAGGWTALGSWDMRRAYIVDRSRFLPRTEAVEDLVRRLGYSHEEALRLYSQVSAMKSAAELEEFVAPVQRLIPTEWIPCRSVDGGSEMACRITLTYRGTRSALAFNYNTASPTNGRLQHDRREGRPGVIVLAGARRLEENVAAAPEFPDIGVLLDAPNRRMLIGTSLLVRSALVQLFYLEERYSKHYKKFDQRSTPWGDQVVTWKIDWESQ